MLKLDQKGILNPLTIPLVLAILLFVGVGVMAGKFYMDFTTQRDENEPIIAAAVEEAEAAQKAELEKEFTEKEKEPNETYIGPSEFGSVKMTYPKTWSVYVNTGSGRDLDFYAHPAYVPAQNVNYALRMSVTSRDFSSEIKQYDAEVKKGTLKASSVSVSGTKGVRLDGFLKKDQEGTMVVFPLRDKTLRVWTENKEFRGDFDNIVLKKLSFIP